MEMTPGQMMEAEMSASGCLLDDVMMGPTGDCGVDPDTTDLLMSGLTDEPLFSGQHTSCLFEKLLSVSAIDQANDKAKNAREYRHYSLIHLHPKLFSQCKEFWTLVSDATQLSNL